MASWKKRVESLISKYHQVDPEEYRKLQQENGNLEKALEKAREEAAAAATASEKEKSELSARLQAELSLEQTKARTDAAANAKKVGDLESQLSEKSTLLEATQGREVKALAELDQLKADEAKTKADHESRYKRLQESGRRLLKEKQELSAKLAAQNSSSSSSSATSFSATSATATSAAASESSAMDTETPESKPSAAVPVAAAKETAAAKPAVGSKPAPGSKPAAAKAVGGAKAVAAKAPAAQAKAGEPLVAPGKTGTLVRPGEWESSHF